MIVIYHRYVYKLYYVCAKSPQSCLFAALWTVNHQAPLFLEFSRQEYWSRLPCPPPGIFQTQGSNSGLSCLLHWQVGFYHQCHQRNFIIGTEKKQYKNQFGNLHGFKHPLGFLGSILSRYGETIVVSLFSIMDLKGNNREMR